MRTIILTHNEMPGEVELRYDDDRAILCGLTIRGEPKAVTLQWILANVPLSPHTDFAKFKANSFKVTEIDELITFDLFWSAYGQKINRGRCEKLWDKMSNVERRKAYDGLAPYFRHLAANQWKSKADPETYLKKKYWNNEWN